MQVDLFNDVKCVKSAAPVVTSDDTPLVGAIIDHANFGSALYVIQSGVLADAGATFTVLVEHGDAANLSDAAAVPDAQLIGTEAGASFNQADDGEVWKIGYIGGKRYTRVTITPSGNAGSAPLNVLCILGHPRKQPQSTQNT